MANWRMHPEEGDLLRYCDGELRAEETARVARHLEACWDCRTRLDDLTGTIAEYMRYRRDILEPALPQPPRPWANLRFEFARVEAPKRLLPRPAVWLVAGTLTAGTGILYYAAKPHPPAAVPYAQVPAPAARPLPAPPAAPARRVSPVAAPGPEDELRAIAALDRIGADLGDPIEVARTPARVVVTCIGLDAVRMHEVQDALAGLPHVEVKLSPKPAPSAAGSPLEVVGTPQTASAAAYDHFVDGLLKNSDAIMARAHALRRLATSFPADVEARLPADSRALLESIRQRHEAGLAREVASLEQSVRPYLGPPAARAPGSPAPQDWQARALRVFAEAAQVDRMVGAAFAGSQGAIAAAADPAALAAAMAMLDGDVAR
ncbi:MAG: hypothetical protein ABSC93_10675 [Bryobacteraceae bacterium]|jgi:hypothetical protein